MVAMATNSNITVPQKYIAKYKNVGYGWDTSHPTTISKKFIILIYHYLHAVKGPLPPVRNAQRESLVLHSVVQDLLQEHGGDDRDRTGSIMEADFCETLMNIPAVK